MRDGATQTSNDFEVCDMMVQDRWVTKDVHTLRVSRLVEK